MQDGGDEAAEARLTITSVRSTPPGYTGQRQANLMLKFEPADHPFIVKCGRLVGGGVDKDHLGAWYVPHFMMDGFCFYLATASNGQPLRDFDFWTDALSPVWMEVLLNAMTEAGAFSGQPFSRWATEALPSLRGFALGCSERDLNVDSVCTSFDPLPLPSGAPAGAEAASRSRSSSARGSSSSSYARVTRSSAAGPVSGPPAGSRRPCGRASRVWRRDPLCAVRLCLGSQPSTMWTAQCCALGESFERLGTVWGRRWPTLRARRAATTVDHRRYSTHMDVRSQTRRANGGSEQAPVTAFFWWYLRQRRISSG